jgi:hypothetical protein
MPPQGPSSSGESEQNPAEKQRLAQAAEQFSEATTDLWRRREEFIKRALTERGLDYEMGLQTHDMDLASQETPDAQAYAEVQDALLQRESEIAVTMTKGTGRDRFSIAVAPDTMLQAENYVDPSGALKQKQRIYLRNGDNIVGSTMEGDVDKHGELSFSAEAEAALALEKELGLNSTPLTLGEAESAARFARVIRRYVAQDLYDRLPIPGDPA